VFPVSFWTEIFVTFGGLFGYFILILFFQLPLLSEWELNKNWLGWFVRLIRDSIAVLLCSLVWKGIYNIFDLYTFDPTILRNVTYIFIGYISFIITGTLHYNTQI
jgi:hypothetical protein